MKRVTEAAHDRVRASLRHGDRAIDATAGNGWDTQFLAESVGSCGQVWALDVQPAALEATARRLAAAGLSNVELIQADHARMETLIPLEFHGHIQAIMFNLGYLPGGDKSVVTQTPSTITALAAAVRLLAAGGVLSVIAYPGHPGGAAEQQAVDAFLCQLTPSEFTVECPSTSSSSQPAGPQPYLVIRH